MPRIVEVTIECFRCHRPVGKLHWAGDRASFDGQIVSETTDDVLTTYSSAPRRWAAATVVSTEPGMDGVSGAGRKTIVCRCGKGRGRPPITRAVRQSQLDAAFRRAVEAGHARISLLDLHD